jgi:hypothetical protein
MNHDTDADLFFHSSDATAGWSTEGKNASVQHSWPAFASQILETKKWIETL